MESLTPSPRSQPEPRTGSVEQRGGSGRVGPGRVTCPTGPCVRPLKKSRRAVTHPRCAAGTSSSRPLLPVSPRAAPPRASCLLAATPDSSRFCSNELSIFHMPVYLLAVWAHGPLPGSPGKGSFCLCSWQGGRLGRAGRGRGAPGSPGGQQGPQMKTSHKLSPRSTAPDSSPTKTLASCPSGPALQGEGSCRHHGSQRAGACPGLWVVGLVSFSCPASPEHRLPARGRLPCRQGPTRGLVPACLDHSVRLSQGKHLMGGDAARSRDLRSWLWAL